MPVFKEVDELIKKGDSLIKIINADIKKKNPEDVRLLKEIKYPATERVRPYTAESKGKQYDREWVLNPKDVDRTDRTKMENPPYGKRELSHPQGAAKPEGWGYTQKTATSLLPPNGKMRFAGGDRSYIVGLMFDVNKCELKDEKYIFEASARTVTRWWIKQKGKDALWDYREFSQKSIPLKELKKKLEDGAHKGKIPKCVNEILACVSKEALCGLFITHEDPNERLNVIRVHHFILDYLGIDLPILIFNKDKEDGYREYTVDEQKKDMLSGHEIVRQSLSDAASGGGAPKNSEEKKVIEIKGLLDQIAELNNKIAKKSESQILADRKTPKA